MIKFTVVCVLLAAAYAQHQHQDHVSSSHGTGNDVHAKVLSESAHVHHEGFNYQFATDNGISAKASGDSHGNIQGDFSWTSPEGVNVALNYVADENGYQPSGQVLPTPPPIPEAILKSLKYISSHPSKEDEEDNNNHDHSQENDDHEPYINIRRS